MSAPDDATHAIFDEGATKVRDGRPGRFWMDDSIYDVWGERLGVYGLLCRRADAKAAWDSSPTHRRPLRCAPVKRRLGGHEIDKER